MNEGESDILVIRRIKKGLARLGEALGLLLRMCVC